MKKGTLLPGLNISGCYGVGQNSCKLVSGILHWKFSLESNKGITSVGRQALISFPSFEVDLSLEAHWLKAEPFAPPRNITFRNVAALRRRAWKCGRLKSSVAPKMLLWDLPLSEATMPNFSNMLGVFNCNLKLTQLHQIQPLRTHAMCWIDSYNSTPRCCCV